MELSEIIPAQDVLQDELENVRGGWSIHLCFSGCDEGGKKDDKDDKGDKGEEVTPGN